MILCLPLAHRYLPPRMCINLQEEPNLLFTDRTTSHIRIMAGVHLSFLCAPTADLLKPRPALHVNTVCSMNYPPEKQLDHFVPVDLLDRCVPGAFQHLSSCNCPCCARSGPPSCLSVSCSGLRCPSYITPPPLGVKKPTLVTTQRVTSKSGTHAQTKTIIIING